MAAEHITDEKLKPAAKSGTLSGKNPDEWAQAAFAQGLITAEEHATFVRAKRLADEAIRVDHFPQDLGLSEMARPAEQAVRSQGTQPRVAA